MDLLLTVGFVFATQILILWCSFGFEGIPIIIFGIVLGAIIGLVTYLLYSEIILFLESLSKIDVRGKTVLITGCDSGFGLLLAESLMKRGMFVFAAVLSVHSNGAQHLGSLPSAKVIKMDVTNDKEVDDAFHVVDKHLSETNTILFAVVNNAGIGCSRMLQFVPLSKVRQLFEVNSLGILRVCQRFSNLLRHGKGRIVNVTSVAGFHVSPFLGPYCASKFSAEAISKALRIELYSLGIPVITVQPNSYKTPILLSSSEELYGEGEIALYGVNFMLQCKKNLTDWVVNSSENLQEVIDALENAILNKRFQYNYIPGARYRFLSLSLKFLSETHLVTTGCRDTALSIPTTIS